MGADPKVIGRTDSSATLEHSRSGLSQIPDHEVRYLVDKMFCSFVGEDVRAVQHCRVCQRLHYCDAK
jgi:hypothetical protein